MTENEKALEFYNRTLNYLQEMARERGIPLTELEWYFVPSDCSEHNKATHIYEYERGVKITTWKQKALMSFVFHAQNQTGNHIDNIVKFKDNIEYIYDVLRGFDPTEILNSYPNERTLVEAFRNKTDANGKNVFVWKVNPENPDVAITQFAKSIRGSCELINRFIDRNQLIQHMKDCLNNAKYEKRPHRGKIKLDKLQKAFGVPGIGSALVCDLLKEFDSDFSTLIKPDIHIKDFLDIYDDVDEDHSYRLKDNEAYLRFIEIVDAINQSLLQPITAYKVDKMVWLVCSGNFYMHSSKSKKDYLNLISTIE